MATKVFYFVIYLLNMAMETHGIPCFQNNITIECDTGCCGDLPPQYCCPDHRKETPVVIAIIIASTMGVAIMGAMICVCAKRIPNWRRLTKVEADHGTTSNIVILFAGEIQDKTPLIKPNMHLLRPVTERSPYCMFYLPTLRENTPTENDVTKTPIISVINSNHLRNAKHGGGVFSPGSHLGNARQDGGMFSPGSHLGNTSENRGVFSLDSHLGNARLDGDVFSPGSHLENGRQDGDMFSPGSHLGNGRQHGDVFSPGGPSIKSAWGLSCESPTDSSQAVNEMSGDINHIRRAWTSSDIDNQDEK